MTDGRALRFLLLPHDADHGGVQRMRWTYENGHPGQCSLDHWHTSPEAALDCFKGIRPAGRALGSRPSRPDVEA